MSLELPSPLALGLPGGGYRSRQGPSQRLPACAPWSCPSWREGPGVSWAQLQVEPGCEGLPESPATCSELEGRSPLS